MVFVLAAEPNHADFLPGTECHGINVGFHVHEHHYRARAVVHVELVAVRQVVLGCLGDTPHHLNQLALGGLAYFYRAQLAGFHFTLAGQYLDLVGVYRHQRQQPIALADSTRSAHLLAGPQLQVVLEANEQAAATVLHGEAAVVEAGVEGARRRGDNTFHRNYRADGQRPRHTDSCYRRGGGSSDRNQDRSHDSAYNP